MHVERTGIVKGTHPASTSHCPTTRFSPFAVVSSGQHKIRMPGWPAWLSRATTRLAAQKQSQLQASNIHVLHGVVLPRKLFDESCRTLGRRGLATWSSPKTTPNRPCITTYCLRGQCLPSVCSLDDQSCHPSHSRRGRCLLSACPNIYIKLRALIFISNTKK